jgi:purine-binding chemotaxis protein CheW
VINLRGSVVPVADLRVKFGLSATEKTVNTCVIIAEVTVEGDTTVLGCLADSVQEVIELSPGDISAAPKIGTRLRTEFIRGMGRRDDRFIILLDIDRIFSVDDLTLAETVGEETSSLP